VVCVGVAGLESLASAVIGATAQLGQMPDKRGFTGHITLARLDEGARPNPASVIPCRWTVGTFALVRSHLGGGRARYETLSTWPVQP
jgi:2'-5' RNA ligase